MKDIILTAPKDLKKGEEFSLDSALGVNKNKAAFESLIDSRSEMLAKSKIDQIRNEIESKLTKENDLKLRETQLSLKSSSQEIIQQAKNEVSISNIKLKEKEQRIDELNKTLNKIEDVYRQKNDLMNTMLKQELEARYKEKLNIETMKITEEKNILQEKLTNANKLKTVNEIGEIGEQEIKKTLKNMFDTDNIKDTVAQQNEADIIQEIDALKDGGSKGSIYYEVKNRNKWQLTEYKKFVKKITEENKSHDVNIFIGKELPSVTPPTQDWVKINSEFYYDKRNDIYLVSFVNWLSVSFTLRNKIIELSKINSDKKNIFTTQQLIFDYVNSYEFEANHKSISDFISKTKEAFEKITKESIKGQGFLSQISIKNSKSYETIKSTKGE